MTSELTQRIRSRNKTLLSHRNALASGKRLKGRAHLINLLVVTRGHHSIKRLHLPRGKLQEKAAPISHPKAVCHHPGAECHHPANAAEEALWSVELAT